jgi:hypothetical protein
LSPTTTGEFRDLALAFGATCTKGSMMFGVSKIISKLTDKDEMPCLATSLPAFSPLLDLLGQTGGDQLTLEVLCEHFASTSHFTQILEKGTIVGNEIDLEPRELRPVLHTLLPLDYDGVYRNAGIEIEILGLTEFDRAVGVGFWAAHLAGKIWIPRDEDYRQHLLAMQAKDPVFVRALRKVTDTHRIVDYYECRRLSRQTQEAKEEMAM